MRIRSRNSAGNPPTNNALDAEPPIASFMKSMLIGGGPVNADVLLDDGIGGWLARYSIWS